MNILQILPELNVGGVETGTLDTVRCLVKLGHKAVVISAGGSLVKEIESSGGRHYHLPVHEKSILSIIKLIPQVASIIRKEEIDIIHARSRVPAWIAYFAARKTTAIFITTCHGYYSKHPFSYVMGWAKKVIVLSNIIGRHMIDDFGVPYEKIKLIPRGVDIDKFQYIEPEKKDTDVFNIGIIGRITPLKGHMYFIKAMAYVKREIPNIRVWVVGDAPRAKEAYKEQLLVLTKRLGLSDVTQFLGTQKDIPGILSQLNLLVLSTVTQEAFGRVVIEAQASGVPVVATRVGGVVDIIDDYKTGRLVPACDEQAIACAIVELYKDKKMVSTISKAAYEKVKEKYSVSLMVENTIKVYEEALREKKILVIKLSSLGDIILSIPAIRSIRQKFQNGYRISVLVSNQYKEVLMRCPYLDELIVCDFKNRDNGFAAFLKLASKLRRKNFDTVIDLQNNRRSHILSGLSFAKSRYGYNNKKYAFFLNKKINDANPLLDPISHQFRILAMMGVGLADKRIELWPSREDEMRVNELLKSEWLSEKQKLAGINLSASRRWKSKNWPLGKIAELCDELQKRDVRVVISGTFEDTPDFNQLSLQTKNSKLINFCGKTSVNQLACLIKKCAVFISPDSAPLHIAAGLSVPVVALFGPTDPKRHAPKAPNCAVINKGLSCSPCYKPKCNNNKCMGQITPEEVMVAIDSLLKNHTAK
jgi:lipopolysaccharide heptosyltransferase II